MADYGLMSFDGNHCAHVHAWAERARLARIAEQHKALVARR